MSKDKDFLRYEFSGCYRIWLERRIWLFQDMLNSYDFSDREAKKKLIEAKLCFYQFTLNEWLYGVNKNFIN